VGDVVAAFVASIERPPEQSRLLDIGSGAPADLLDVARMVAEQCGAPEPRVTGQYRLGDVRAASCSIDAARAEIGYDPQVSLDDGLAQLLAWIGSTKVAS